MHYRSLLRGEETLTDFGRILIAALTALIVVYALRPWAIGLLGFGNLLGRLGSQADELLGRLGIYLLGAYLVPDFPIVRRANPSMGLRPTNSTSSASFHMRW